MEIKVIVDFLLLTAAIQGFLFNIFVFTSKRKISKAILYLNLTILFFSLNNFRSFLVDNDYFYDIVLLYWLPVPWHLLIVPMFYGFLVYYLKVEDRVENYIKLTLNIFTIEMIIRLLIIFVLIPMYPNIENRSLEIYSTCEEMLNSLYSFFIMYKIWQLVFKNQNLFDEILKFDPIKWIRISLRLGLFVMILWLTAIIGYMVFNNAIWYYPSKLTSSLLIYWMGYQGLYRYQMIADRIALRNKLSFALDSINTAKSISSKKNYKEQPILDKHELEFNTIDNYVHEHQRYLDPNLSMNVLAEEMDVSNSHFSKIVNTYSRNNFTDYINFKRVDHAKNILSDSNFDNYTVVAIGLESGFNSKSTFYAAFKKFTSMTPTDYRKKLN